MLRTRVGYCGGTALHPTYRSIGDHTEAISIDYDPTQINFVDLLAHFWNGHHSQSMPFGRQYMHAVFYRNESQRALAIESLDEHASSLGVSPNRITTSIVPVGEFTIAELYHQKYRIRSMDPVRVFLESTYPEVKAFADSSVGTRINVLAGRQLDAGQEQFLAEIPDYGLPPELAHRLRQQLQR